MTKCRICERDNPASAQHCESCGAWLDAPAEGRTDDSSAAAKPASAGDSSGAAESEVLQLLRAGRKIDAIKVHRAQTGLGLKESKDAVEALAKQYGIESKAGCAGVLLLVAVVALLLAGLTGTLRALVADDAGRAAGPKEKAVIAAKSRAANLIEERRVLVIAHRGDSKAAPENTLPAFRSATAVGVDMVELDYHHSSDGAMVVIHDPTLDRTTDAVALWGGAKLPVAGRTFADLAKLDAGKWFGEKFAFTRLCKVEDAIEAIRPGAITLIERKAGDAATLVKQLKATKRGDDVIVQAFDWDYLADCRRLAPELILGALGRDEVSEEKLDQVVAAGAKFVGWADKDVTPDAVTRVHQRGLRAYVFTVDDPRRAAELIDFGVDGLISNEPAEIKKVVAQKAAKVAN